MVLKYSTILFSCLSLSLTASTQALSPKPWSQPDWGFARSKTPSRSKPAVRLPVSKSLLFDQEFDTRTVRPMPPTLARAKPEDRQAPSPHLASVKSSPASITNIQTQAQESLQDLLPETQLRSPASDEGWKIFEKVKTEAEITEATPLSFLRKPEVAAVPVPSVPAKMEPAIAPAEATPIVASAVALSSPPIDPVPAEAQEILEVSSRKFKIPSAQKGVAKLYVVAEDETGYPGNMIPGAVVSWMSENSPFAKSVSNEDGVVVAPPGTQSLRYIINAPGYLPAVGYAIQGMTLPVILLPNSRLPATMASLNLVQDPDRSFVFGKIVDPDLKPVSRVIVESTDLPDPFRIFYSDMNFGLLNPLSRATGPKGEFFISGMGRNLVYLSPIYFPGNSDRFTFEDAKAKEWASTVIDTRNTPSVYSLTLVEPVSTTLKLEVVDAETEESVNFPVPVTVGGQSGLPEIAAGNGKVLLNKVTLRNTPDLIDISPGENSGYKQTWLSGPGNTPESRKWNGIHELLPQTVWLYSENFLNSLFGKSEHEAKTDIYSPEPNLDLDLKNKGLVIGQLRREKYTKSVEIKVYNSSTGTLSESAKVLYLNDSDRYRVGKGTHPQIQDFAIANLNDGEYVVEALNAKDQKVLVRQMVRSKAGILSLIQL